jgi:hypothetical protein
MLRDDRPWQDPSHLAGPHHDGPEDLAIGHQIARQLLHRLVNRSPRIDSEQPRRRGS